MKAVDLLNESTWTDEVADEVDSVTQEGLAEIFDVDEEDVKLTDLGESMISIKVLLDEERRLKGHRNPLQLLSKVGFHLSEEGAADENGKRYLLFENW
jgi:hypothetical protein